MSNLMEAANAQVRRLIERVLSLPEGYMRPSHQRADASRQGAPFGSVLIMNAENVGWASRSTEEDGAGGLNEVLEVPVQFVASVQFFKNAPRAADLRGGAISDDVTAYHGVTNGGFDVRVDGTLLQVAALDLSGAADMPAVAVAVQAKLAVLLAGVTCAWTGKRLVIASPTTGQSSAVGAGAAPTGAGSPVDVSTLLGLTLAAGASPSDNKTGIAKPGLDAVELARRLTTMLQRSDSVAYMRTVGCSLVRMSQVRDLSAINDAAWESRGSVDLTFNVITRETFAVTPIESAEITVSAQIGGSAQTREAEVTT